MRVIKFRGKDFDGKWLYGDLRHHNGIDVCIFSQTKNSGQPVNKDTVGQFTGLKDKNGREIYEGDIVSTSWAAGIFGVITWHPHGYFFIDDAIGLWRRYEGCFHPLGDVMERGVDFDGTKILFEVVGNIHDNPELLTNGQ